MAPDLNSLGSNGRWDYSTPGSNGYDIPDIIYNVSAVITSIHCHQADIASGSFDQEAEGINYRSWLLWYSDGIPNPEVYQKR
jgi:hypothetical protein